MKYLYITNNPILAEKLDQIGVDMVWVDLEKNGKEERQKNMNTVKSNHSLEDVEKIAPLLKHSQLLVRVNPIFEGSLGEINRAILNGADCIMLPMFKSKKEVDIFFDIVAGRCDTILLLETKEAVENLDDILQNKNIKNIHIGLNDLSLSYGNKFMFEPLANGLVEKICQKLRDRNVNYGIGGIARLGGGDLPAELILSEYVRLGSKQVILSRSFCKLNFNEDTDKYLEYFQTGIEELNNYERKLENTSIDILENNRKVLISTVEEILRRGEE